MNWPGEHSKRELALGGVKYLLFRWSYRIPDHWEDKVTGKTRYGKPNDS
jgi:hypothetical protein